MGNYRKDPFPHANKPKTNYKKRDIWTADMIRKALDECDDMKLYVAMNEALYTVPLLLPAPCVMEKSAG